MLNMKYTLKKGVSNYVYLVSVNSIRVCTFAQNQPDDEWRAKGY